MINSFSLVVEGPSRGYNWHHYVLDSASLTSQHLGSQTSSVVKCVIINEITKRSQVRSPARANLKQQFLNTSWRFAMSTVHSDWVLHLLNWFFSSKLLSFFKTLQCLIGHTHTPGNTKGGSITVPLTSCLTGLESAVWQLTIFVFICKTD